MASLYNSVAILVASPIFRQSMSQKRADTVVVNETQSLTNVRGVEPVTSSHWARVVPPQKLYMNVIAHNTLNCEQSDDEMTDCNDDPHWIRNELSRRRVGASPEYWLIMPLLAAWGTGMVSVMGLWNFLRRGSTVTMGDTATRLPNILATNSLGMGCACEEEHCEPHTNVSSMESQNQEIKRQTKKIDTVTSQADGTDTKRPVCPFLGLKRFTWRPTLIFLVSAPWGNTACTWGTTLDDTIPPSGPMACTSCRTRETMAKYCGKSVVRMRVMRLHVLNGFFTRLKSVLAPRFTVVRAQNHDFTLLASQGAKVGHLDDHRAV
ncbi:hypothetical protein B566_EDAN007888 [Ephemera danica]|nr:hypothetical protein B566_EDAN007888 [Ephemera danica]